LLSSGTSIAYAQATEVPDFDNNGDFKSSRVLGNRGTYAHKQWLVVDPDGLNCRNEQQSVVVTLSYGSVVDAVFSNNQDNAIRLIDGKPWLRVSVSLFDIQTRQTNNRLDTYTCYVRANREYIAPINPDSQSE
jgi:hypothetical protein